MSSMSEPRVEKIELPFEKIRQLSFYKSKDDDRFYKDIESMGDKLFHYILRLELNGNIQNSYYSQHTP